MKRTQRAMQAIRSLLHAFEEGRIFRWLGCHIVKTGCPQHKLEILLACLVELLPWLTQWHNEIDPAYGIGMGDFFSSFLDEQARALGTTMTELRQWRPEKK